MNILQKKMSHLPLDARAILHYLNELGYTNITAVQLKEFLKGMQPQSDIISRSKFKIKTNLQQQKYNHQKQQFQIQLSGAISPPPPPTTTSKTASATSHSFTPNKNTTFQSQQQRSSSIKIIKSKQPLCNFKFFIDLSDLQLTRRIEDKIKFLGGSLEFILNNNVTHFITDKTLLPPSLHNFSNNNSCPDTPKHPVTPSTPGTPEAPHSVQDLQHCCRNKTKNDFNSNHYSTGSTRKSTATTRRQSRADALLKRARQNQSANNLTFTEFQSSNNHQQQQQLLFSVSPPHLSTTIYTPSQSVIVWQLEYALHFFKKVQHELKDYLDSPRELLKKFSCSSKDPIHLKSGFIKIEAIKRNCRPYYQLFKKPNEWPKIGLSREDGAFRLSPKREYSIQANSTKLKTKRSDVNTMTRKSRSRSSSKQQNGVQKIKKSRTNSQRNGSRLGSDGAKNATICKPQQQRKETTDKQCGVCEICKIEYDALTIHLKTKDHEYFAKNPQNFTALDTLIHTSADVNKFLQENKKIKIKSEPEDVEVDTEETSKSNRHTDNVRHMMTNASANSGSSNNSTRKKLLVSSEIQNANTTNMLVNTASPTLLREKSKRTTKGKHSSEKFQHIIKSPKNTSPSKPVASITVTHTTTIPPSLHVTSTPLLETTLSKNRKKTALSVVSPPLRAVLPQSPLYKVVESHTDVCTTPKEGTRAGGHASGAVASPSLIVKFKKVRATELQVLNGEAESFMFPKRRAESSDLSTDIDRHTTSDRLGNTTSSSLNSSSGWLNISEDICNEICDQVTNKLRKSDNTALRKITNIRTVATKERNISSTAKRRTANSCSTTLSVKQNFPIAPIQPEQQQQKRPIVPQKKLATTATNTNTKVPNNNVARAAIVEATAAVLPEATRKSSRTATAIVTAATTSSRLLQAAVEAAKHKNRSGKMVIITATTTATTTMKEKPPKKSKKVFEAELSQKEGKRVFRRNAVIKLEDRMGEQIINNREQQQGLTLLNDEDEDEDIDFDDFDDATVDNDDAKDEDFVLGTAKRKTKITKNKRNNSLKNSTSRQERAARREQRLKEAVFIKSEPLSEPEMEQELFRDSTITSVNPTTNTIESKNKSRKNVKLNRTPKKKTASRGTKSKSKKQKEQQPQASRFFDFTKSEQLKNFRYAFERLPESDLWYRVYMRQDKCEEKYFEYFGSNTYRKLPYELGPMPFILTTSKTSNDSAHCTLCQKSVDVKQAITNEIRFSEKPLHQGILPTSNMVKEERSEEKQEEKSLVKGSDYVALSRITTDKTISNSTSTTPIQYTHKHKKLHLLQRYREEQEQQALLQKQQQEQQEHYHRPIEKQENEETETITSYVNGNSGLGYLREHRALSTNSNASSYTSSSTIGNKSKKILNKNLNKASYLAHLELPPRKSPREHASTLALVSCIIKQRQDSTSKPNSEQDEPPTPIQNGSKQHQQTLLLLNRGGKAIANTPVNDVNVQSSQDIKPVLPISVGEDGEKEVRFATEISETVKRMRRGRNKYDYSPPFVVRKQGRSKGGGTQITDSANCVVATSVSSTTSCGRRSPACNASVIQRNQTPNVKMCRSALANGSICTVTRDGRQNKTCTTTLPSIRKTGSKKGVLEFDMDEAALKALKTSVNSFVPTPQQLEWQIDKYLMHAWQQYDLDMDGLVENVSLINQGETDFLSRIQRAQHNSTPPVTGYFSSDFDLYDLLNLKLKREGTTVSVNTDGLIDCESNNFLKNDGGCCVDLNDDNRVNLLNNTILHNYIRRRKTLKSNRTGWPRVNKKKLASSRSLQEQQNRQKIFFLHSDIIKQQHNLQEAKSITKTIKTNTRVKREDSDSGKHRAVITPPDSNTETQSITENVVSHRDDLTDTLNADSQMLIDDDDNDDVETMADFMEYEPDGADADVEEVDEDEYDVKLENEDEDEEESVQEKDALKHSSILSRRRDSSFHRHYNNEPFEVHGPPEKRLHCIESLLSPVEKVRSSVLSNPLYATTACSSTPTQHLMRTLRCTPQLNGSLGSCISPSEKAGDNSDIFTVSSDGLDTDLDLSNSHSHQCKMTDDESRHNLFHHHNHHLYHHHHHQYHQYCHDGTYQPVTTNANANTNVTTPKRKFDLSKYAPKNGATCAAEAATAAVKSLAISQFLKKEVRVTCRRLRAPFRRFRYRR